MSLSILFLDLSFSFGDLPAKMSMPPTILEIPATVPIEHVVNCVGLLVVIAISTYGGNADSMSLTMLKFFFGAWGSVRNGVDPDYHRNGPGGVHPIDAGYMTQLGVSWFGLSERGGGYRIPPHY